MLPGELTDGAFWRPGEAIRAWLEGDVLIGDERRVFDPAVPFHAKFDGGSMDGSLADRQRLIEPLGALGRLEQRHHVEPSMIEMARIDRVQVAGQASRHHHRGNFGRVTL